MFPEGERNDAGPFAAACTTTVVGAGAGAGATVTVTGAGADTGAGASAGVAVTVTVGADTGDAAGMAVGAGVEPADEQPANATAVRATNQRFLFMREGSRDGLGGFLARRDERPARCRR